MSTVSNRSTYHFRGNFRPTLPNGFTLGLFERGFKFIGAHFVSLSLALQCRTTRNHFIHVRRNLPPLAHQFFHLFWFHDFSLLFCSARAGLGLWTSQKSLLLVGLKEHPQYRLHLGQMPWSNGD